MSASRTPPSSVAPAETAPAPMALNVGLVEFTEPEANRKFQAEVLIAIHAAADAEAETET